MKQSKYAAEILDMFGMSSSKPVSTPIVLSLKLCREGSGDKVDTTYYKQMVGSLMYLIATRPDLMFAVSLISRYMEAPFDSHLQAVKRILRYLKGTVDQGIVYKRSGNKELTSYTDNDYAGDYDDRKSTYGYVFVLASSAVGWSAKKQPVVTLSTTEAEFIAAANCACQTVWLRRVLEKIELPQSMTSLIYCDNSSTIKLSKNLVLHGRSKHIDIRFHFLRDLVNQGIIELSYCSTDKQIADTMTKALKI